MALDNPADLIEINPHMKYQLATINRSWNLDKNVNLVYGRTYRRTDNPNALRPQQTEAAGA